MENIKRASRTFGRERHVALRAFLVAGSLVSMLLASGASSHWF